MTGSGKSAAANFLFNKEVFESEDGLNRVTEKCVTSISTIFEKNVKVIDTPGFFDGFTSTEDDIRELSRFSTYAKDGLHAVVFVMSCKRFTEGCEKAVQRILYFEGVAPFVFVLLTHAKRNGITKGAAYEYIKKTLSSPNCAPGLKKLMHLVDNRVVMIESVDAVGEEYQKQKSKEFVAMIESIHKTNGNKIYINDMLFSAAQLYEKAAKPKQGEEATQTEVLLKSNAKKILILKRQANDTTYNKETMKIQIASLMEEKENLENQLENIKSKQYLEQLTINMLYRELKKKAVTGMDIVGLVASIFGGGAVVSGLFGAVGGILGGLIGSVIPGIGTSVVATYGAYIGAGLGGVGTVGATPDIVRDFYKDKRNKDVVVTNDCKQQ